MLISAPFRVSGVLTDVTSMVLSDETATYGVKRVDNNVVVVAAGTPMVHDGTGLYSIEVTEPAPNLTYRYVLEIVYQGATYHFMKLSYGSPATVSTYTIATLRGFFRQYVRNAASSAMYPDTNVDRSIQLAADEWIRITKCTKTSATFSLTAGSNQLPAAPAGWMPEFHLQQFLSLSGNLIFPNIEFVGYDDVLAAQAQNNASVSSPLGQPRLFGYKDTSTGICWPTPDQNYTLNVWYWTLFNSWTPGTTPSPNSFALTDEALRIICTDGGEAFSQANEPSNASLAASALARFRDRAREYASRGAGFRGGNVATKNSPNSYPASVYDSSCYIPRG